MKTLKKLGAIFDSANSVLAVLAGVVIVSLMLIITYEVIIRYFLNRSLVWSVEITGYSLLYVTFLAAAWLLRSEGHVRMDLLIERLNPRAQALMNTLTSIMGVAICLTILIFGVKVSWESYQLGYFMSSEMRPPQYLILIIIPIGMLMLSVQFARRSYGYLMTWKSLLGRR